MSVTDFGALTSTQKTVWAMKTWQQGRDQSFWFQTKLIGENDNSPVQRITELTPTDSGDKCIMQLVADLIGDGVVGDNDLEGKEESLVNDDFELMIDQLRNAAKSKGRMAQQRVVVKFREQAKGKLAFWLGDKMDELAFLTIAGRSFTLKTDGSARSNSQLSQLQFAAQVTAPSTNRIMYAGGVAGVGSLTATDTMSWDLVVETCAKAKRSKIRPIRMGGKDYYILVMSTEQFRDLKMDADYRSAVQNAGSRGPKNPMFTGESAVVDGVFIYEHNKVCNTLGMASASKWGAGGLIDGAQAQLIGAQALGMATIDKVFWNESDNTDYGNKRGVSVGRMFGLAKPVLKTSEDDSKQDFGTITIYTAAAAQAA